jgi:hypothetical protein
MRKTDLLENTLVQGGGKEYLEKIRYRINEASELVDALYTSLLAGDQGLFDCSNATLAKVIRDRLIEIAGDVEISSS